MDEEKIQVEETEEPETETGSMSEIEKVFEDDDWDSDDSEDDFDLGETEEPAEEDTNSEAEETEEPETEEPAAEQKPTKYTLKHLDETKEYTLDEVLSLANKGLDYDFVRTERDTLKPMKGYEDFLKEVVERSGAKDIDEQILRTRAMWLVADEAEKGNDISEADAILRLQKEAPKMAAKKEPEKASEQDAEEANHQMLMRFIDEYPDVDAKSIPQEVWQECQRTGDLVGAYRKYEIKNLKAENETLKRNQKNRERSTGSRRTAGATTPKDAFDEAWDSDF